MSSCEMEILRDSRRLWNKLCGNCRPYLIFFDHILIQEKYRAMAFLEHIPWVIGPMDYLDLTPENSKRFYAFGNGCINKRREKGSVQRDLFYFIVGMMVVIVLCDN